MFRPQRCDPFRGNPTSYSGCPILSTLGSSSNSLSCCPQAPWPLFSPGPAGVLPAAASQLASSAPLDPSSPFSSQRPQSFHVNLLIKAPSWVFTALRTKSNLHFCTVPPLARGPHRPAPPPAHSSLAAALSETRPTKPFSPSEPCNVGNPGRPFSLLPTWPTLVSTSCHLERPALTPGFSFQPVILYLGPLCCLRETDHNVQLFLTSLLICFAP